jgi:Kef-type K+ transport system membrane component KefB
MTDFPVLVDLGLVVLGATAVLAASRPLGVPPLLGYMVAGLVLGPALGLLGPSPSTELFSKLGIALLLFVVGLEMSLEKIRVIGKTAVLVGLVQVGITFLLGAGLGRILGFSGGAVPMIGLVAAFSSTVVVIKLLDRGGDLASLHGRLAVGILLVQDVLVAVALTVLGSLGPGVGVEVNAWSGLALSLVGIAGLSLVGAAAARWVLPGLTRWLSETPEGLFVAALAWVFAFILAAETVQVSIELGAFIAGVVLAQLPYNDELRRRTHPLVDFFLAVFFVSLGARMDPVAMAVQWPAALALSAFVILGKPALLLVLLRMAGQTPRVSFLAGLTLGQISEFAFIMSALAATAGLVDDGFFGFVALVGFVTIGVSAVAVPRGPSLFRALEGLGLARLLPTHRSGRAGSAEESSDEWAGHVVVVGMNHLGRTLVRRFVALGEDVVAVDTDAGKLAGLDGADTFLGDVTSLAVVEETGIPRAKLVVSALQIEDVSSLLAYRCRRMGVPVSIHAFHSSMVAELLEIGVDHLMISKLDGIRPMKEAFRRLGVTG